jgi:uncharacterized protein
MCWNGGEADAPEGWSQSSTGVPLMSVPRFWREIPERYTLRASKCGNCQGIHFPPREVCPKCRRLSLGKMGHVKLSGRGRILESTRIHKSAPGYELQVPYDVALVQTEEGPVVTGQIVDSAPETVQPGAHVRSVFRRLGSDGDRGVIYYGTKWTVTSEPPKPKKPAKKKGLLRRKEEEE